MVAQALIVEEDARDDERTREAPAPGLVGAGDEARPEPAVEGEELSAGRRHGARIAPAAAAPGRSRRFRHVLVSVNPKAPGLRILGRMRLLAALLVSAVLTLSLAACGGGEEGGEDEGAAEEVRVSLLDFELDPATISLESAGTYTFAVTNDGQAPHAFEVEGHGIEEETDELDSGGSAELTVDLEEGEYKIYCPVGDHEDRGMVGTLKVGAEGGGGADTHTETETETDTETETGGGLGY